MHVFTVWYLVSTGIISVTLNSWMYRHNELIMNQLDQATFCGVWMNKQCCVRWRSTTKGTKDSNGIHCSAFIFFTYQAYSLQLHWFPHLMGYASHTYPPQEVIIHGSLFCCSLACHISQKNLKVTILCSWACLMSS